MKINDYVHTFFSRNLKKKMDLFHWKLSGDAGKHFSVPEVKVHFHTFCWTPWNVSNKFGDVNELHISCWSKIISTIYIPFEKTNGKMWQFPPLATVSIDKPPIGPFLTHYLNYSSNTLINWSFFGLCVIEHSPTHAINHSSTACNGHGQNTTDPLQLWPAITLWPADGVVIRHFKLHHIPMA
jgi:hypothetical protein